MGLAREACEQGVARLLVGGGDGTTSEVVSGLLSMPESARPTLGLLPFGSGWDLARSLGLPRDFEAALDVIARGTVQTIDVGRLDFRDESGSPCVSHFANEASVGLSGVTVRLVGRLSKRLGPRLGFVLGAVGAILSHRPVDLAVEIDDERIYEGPVSMVVAANGRFFGAGMQVAPGAVIDDGALEVVLVRGLSMPRLLANLPSFYVGKHVEHPRVSCHSARSLSLIPKEASPPVDVDGEAHGALPLRATVVPAALRVFVPAVASTVDGAAAVGEPADRND